jgi:FAD/FMN-containing dehydrogenase
MGDGAGDRLVDELVGVVGPSHVLVDDDVRAPYEIDWTRRFAGTARCVVRPGDVDEVAAVVRACAAEGAAVVAQGGNTGLVGGGVPRGGEVVLSLVRLDALAPVDLVAAEVTAGAGVTLGRLQAHARAAGLDFGVDLAARDSATIGGMVATNAGGVHALRYGPMRAQVVGLQAVLADGRVLERMPGLVKDNTGYDLPGLLVGSEGTLAVVTAARLRLRPLHTARVVALLAVAGTADALRILARLRSALASLDAVEVFHADGLDLVRRHTGAPAPFNADHPTYLLVECAARHDPTDDLVAALADAPEVRDAAVATDGPARERLWSLRERHTEAISAEGIPHKLDVTLPLGELVRFEERLRALLGDVAPDGRAILFGHLGDGNIHVNLLGIEADDDRVDEAVLRLVADHGGSISAEHGIGVAKARWLGLTRSPADIATMAAIKTALDPDHRLNPGVLFER